MSSPNHPNVTSVADLNAFAEVVFQQSANHYEHLAQEMQRTLNPEAAVLFERLADWEKNRISHLRQVRASEEVAKSGKHDHWLAIHGFGEHSREKLDNLYLMTPYRALQYAVYSEERLFSLMSAIAAEAADQAIREQAEGLARAGLGHIADLRLMRRRAFRAEEETAIRSAGLGHLPTDDQAFFAARLVISDVLLPTIEAIERTWSAELSDKIRLELGEISGELKADLAAIEPPNRALRGKAPSLPKEGGLYVATKALLRELEAAFDLLMEMAETSQSESVVSACQSAAQAFVRYLAMIRRQLADLTPSGELAG